jgi:hypothetical protein
LDTQPYRPNMRLTLQSMVGDIPIFAPADDNFDSEAEAKRESLHAHFKHQGVQEPCDHCIYSKGVVWDALSKPPEAKPIKAAAAEDEDEIVPEPAGRIPRSLESVAIEEDIREKKQHPKYMRWCDTERAKVPIDTLLARKRKYAADTPSTAVVDILNSMSKEQMISWLKKKRDGDSIKENKALEDSQRHAIGKEKENKNTEDTQDEVNDEIDDMQYQSMDDIRAYILRTRGQVPQAEPQKKKAKTLLRALKNVADRKAWYEKNKAPELKAEVTRRGIKPVLSKKANMVEVLVRDDLRG